MRSILCAFAVTVVLLAAPPCAAAAELLVIRAERVLEDARRGDPTPRTILVREGRIVAVLAGSDAAIDAHRQDGERVRELRFDASHTLLPGLIDSHVHLTSDPGRQWWQSAVVSSEASAILGVVNAGKTVRAGFTTVRDLGAPRQAAYALRDAIARGDVIGPRILAAGQMISIVGGHGDAGNGFRPDVADALDAGNTCTGAVQCAERVRHLARAGADVIKLAATGGVLSQQNRGLDQHFSDEELAAIVETAHALGLKVAAHAHGPRGVAASARAGVDSIEHGTFVDPAAIRDVKAGGAWLVPTLSPTIAYREHLGTGRYTPVVEAKIRERLEATGRNIRMAHAASIPIAFGTDAGVSDHGRNAEEFALMVREGRLTPREALVAATTGAAELLGLADEIGTVSTGKSADIIAVPGDPLTDITAMERVAFVVARGRVVREVVAQ